MPLRQQTAAAECSSRSSTAIDPVYKKVHNVQKIIKKKIRVLAIDPAGQGSKVK